jgi:type III secretory pathway component EscV
MPDRRPLVPVAIEIGELLVPPPDGTSSGVDLLEERVRSELQRLMRILGIPGDIGVAIAVVPGGGDDLRMRVHGRGCRYPAELISRVWSTLSGGWLAPAGEHRSERPTVLAGDVVATVCREILARRPSALLSDAQAASYVAGSAAADFDPQWVRGTLARVLDARIAIDDREAITAGLGEQQAKLFRNAAEVLIERVRPRHVVVRVQREFLRELTTSPGAADADVLHGARSRVEDELGIAPPEIVFAEGRLLPERGFAFDVGDIETLTWIGLPADRCLVGDSVTTLGLLNIEGEPALHPVTEIDCAVVPLAERETARAFHIPTWGPDEYLGLCLEATLREHASCLVDAATVRARLEGLDGVGASSVVLGRRLPVGRVVRLMRSLLAERVSVSDLPALIEVLAEQAEELWAIVDDGIWSDRADAVQEGRDRSATAAARRRLGRQVAAGVAQHGLRGTITAVVLDQRLHQATCDAADHSEALSGDDDELLNASVTECLGSWPGDSWPVLLTNAKVRSAVRAALEPQFPDLSVIAFEELPFDVDLELAGEVRPVEDRP